MDTEFQAGLRSDIVSTIIDNLRASGRMYSDVGLDQILRDANKIWRFVEYGELEKSDEQLLQESQG